MNEYRAYWANYANFEGRATVREYWMAVLWNFVWTMVIFLPLGLITLALSAVLVGVVLIPVLWVLSFLWALANLIPQMSLQWRRLHDTNRSGAFYFLHFVPVGSIILLIWSIEEGTHGPNLYGEDPREAHYLYGAAPQNALPAAGSGQAYTPAGGAEAYGSVHGVDSGGYQPQPSHYGSVGHEGAPAASRGGVGSNFTTPPPDDPSSRFPNAGTGRPGVPYRKGNRSDRESGHYYGGNS